MLQKMLRDIKRESENVGLSINLNKIMSHSEKANDKLGNTELEYVKHYTFLGQIISLEL